MEYRLNPGMTALSDSSDQQLLCMIYDPSRQLRPGFAEASDTTAYPAFRIMWGVPLHDTTQFTSAFLQSLPGMGLMLAQLRQHPATRFYMSGRQKSGISEIRFVQAVQELNALLYKAKVDTAAFQRIDYNH